MKIIDAHIHFCSTEPYFEEIAVRAGHINSAEHLKEVYEKEHIVKGIVMGNRDLSFRRHTYPEFLSYCVGLDSQYFVGDNRRAAPELVEKHLQRESCVGIKIYAGYCPIYVSDPIYHPYYELAMAYHKPVAIHTGATAGINGLLKYSHPLTVDEVAAAFPKVQFIMCHFGNPWVVDAAAVMNKNPNVAADLSGLLEGMLDLDAFFADNAGYVEHLRTWVKYADGYDRLLYGTDWPLANIQSYIGFVTRLLPEKYLDDVLFHNANRIYQLGL